MKVQDFLCSLCMMLYDELTADSVPSVGASIARPLDNVGAGFPRPREAERLPYISLGTIFVGELLAAPEDKVINNSER